MDEQDKDLDALDQLREAAARILDPKWDTGEYTTVLRMRLLPPLDWTTAGALLAHFYSDLKAARLTSLQISEYGIEVFDYRTLVDGEPLYFTWRNITPRTVIEACVRALGLMND